MIVRHKTCAAQETLIIGDFNLPYINWTTRQSRALGSKFIDLIHTNSLQQHVSEAAKQNNVFDLVMTTPDLRIIGLEVTDNIGDHHNMVGFALLVHDSNDRTQLNISLNYKRANLELMKEELGSLDYEVLMRNKNAKECFMILEEKIATATEHPIPTKQIRPANNPPWFSQENKSLINARQQSYKRLENIQNITLSSRQYPNDDTIYKAK
ncbi:Endonuclease/exonuclease/phosphatase [Trinorchestia longiramus]|nr:Endonuclease/exonuclease/phosphatase [Trinorchestia longiramus]